MYSTFKASILTAALFSITFASRSQADFTYDLRFAPGTLGATDTHNVTLVAAGGIYTVQLWGRINGDTLFNNDGWGSGYVSELSSQANGGAFTSGGITVASAMPGIHVSNHSANSNGTGGTDLNADGIADWGSTSTASPVGWTHWGPDSFAFIDDAVGDAESEQVGPNSWEVLLTTYSITPINLGSQPNGTTTLNPLVPHFIKLGFVNFPGIHYYQDTANDRPFPTANTAVATPIGVTFHLAPEPSSLCLLALGALPLIKRRR